MSTLALFDTLMSRVGMNSTDAKIAAEIRKGIEHLEQENASLTEVVERAEEPYYHE